MPDMDGNIDDMIHSIIGAERRVNIELKRLKEEYKQVFERYDSLVKEQEEIEHMKATVKDRLIEDEDFDLHKVDGYKISVCPVVKLAVQDEDAIDEKYKSTEVVVNVKKAQDYKKLSGRLPEGFVDKTYHRMIWKEDDNAES